MDGNMLYIFLSALIPMFVGFLWYHPKTLGTIWMNQTPLKTEDLEKGNMLMIMGLSYLFSVMIAFVLSSFVIHQAALAGLFAMDPDFAKEGTELHTYFKEFMSEYGTRHRSFGHGVVHGIMLGVFLVLPIIGIISLFERRTWKYVLVNAGYWILTLALMGGVICQFF